MARALEPTWLWLVIFCLTESLGCAFHVVEPGLTASRYSLNRKFDPRAPSRQRTAATKPRTSVTMGLMPSIGSAIVLSPVVTGTAIIGGALAGGLHALSGPDHLAAVVPRCIGKRWWIASRVGALWAIGHGLSASLLGLFAFFLKGRLSKGAGAAHLIEYLAGWSEVAIGASLIAIGALGMNEARNWKSEAEEPLELSPPEATRGKKKGGNRAVFLNGILHGFSVDGAPSFAPALALPSVGAALLFFLSYCIGTVVAMSAVTTVIGEGSLRAGESLDQPDLPQKLSFVSSGLATVVGLFWTARALPSILAKA